MATMTRTAPNPAPSLAAAALREQLAGSTPAQRLTQARATAVHIEALLERIDAGEIEATPIEVARMEGADLALRAVADG
jgi:hypothetical protein